MKAVIRVRRGKSWRYVVRLPGGKEWPARFIMRAFMSGVSTRDLAADLDIDPLTVEQVIREARGVRWWRE